MESFSLKLNPLSFDDPMKLNPNWFLTLAQIDDVDSVDTKIVGGVLVCGNILFELELQWQWLR